MTKELEPARGTPAFIKRFVDNVAVVALDECYVLKEDGTYNYRVCGAIRKDGKRCLAKPGEGTHHEGIGRCLTHDKRFEGVANWKEFSGHLAKGTKLGSFILATNDLEVNLSDVSSEISFQQALILWYINHVMTRDTGKNEEGEVNTPVFTKDDVRFLKELNIDMIRSKESASRIKGSMKLDAIHVRQFVDQIMSYLIGRLMGLMPDRKNMVVDLIRGMVDEVFAPMAATGLVQGDLHPLAQIPEKYQSLKMLKEAEKEKKQLNE